MLLVAARFVYNLNTMKRVKKNYILHKRVTRLREKAAHEILDVEFRYETRYNR